MGSAAKRFRPNMSPDEIIAAMNINNFGRTGKKPPEDEEKKLIEEFKGLLLDSTQRKRILEQYLYLEDHPITHFDKKLKLDFDIQKIRFHVINGDMEAAENCIKDVKLYNDSFDEEQRYYFHKHMGNYFYASAKYKEAFEQYISAEKLILDELNKLEIGDLYYSLGLTASQFFESEKSLKYTEMALKIYLDEFVPKRITECHINLGIIHSRLRNFKKAMDHNHSALKISQELDSNFLRYTTEYNYGYIYLQFQNYDLAIEHISNSLNFLPNEYVADNLLIYNTLTKAAFELGDIEGAINWLNNGEEIVKNIDVEETLHRNVEVVYTEHRVLSYLLNNEKDEYEDLIVNVWIPLLEKRNHLYELGYYYSQLGNYYIKNYDYEKAAHMLSKASKTFQKLITTS